MDADALIKSLSVEESVLMVRRISSFSGWAILVMRPDKSLVFNSFTTAATVIPSKTMGTSKRNNLTVESRALGIRFASSSGVCFANPEKDKKASSHASVQDAF